MLEELKPWVRLYEVIGVLGPIFVFSLALSMVVYLLFAILLPWMGSQANLPRKSKQLGSITSGNTAPDENGSNPNHAIEYNDDLVQEFGYASSFSYVLVASLFGAVLGMLVKLVGGFTALASNAPSNTLFGAIGSIVIIALGVAGSLFADSGKIPLRRPVGAIAFLVSFLVSGFYWQFLRGVAAG